MGGLVKLHQVFRLFFAHSGSIVTNAQSQHFGLLGQNQQGSALIAAEQAAIAEPGGGNVRTFFLLGGQADRLFGFDILRHLNPPFPDASPGIAPSQVPVKCWPYSRGCAYLLWPSLSNLS